MLERPADSLGVRCTDLEGVRDQSLELELVQLVLEGAEHLIQAAAELGLEKAVQYRALEVGNREPDLVDPRSGDPKEVLRCNPREAVADAVKLELRAAAVPLAGQLDLGGGQQEDVARNLLGQAVVVPGRPVAQGGWEDQGRPDLELAEGGGEESIRQRIEAPLEAPQPTALREAVQLLGHLVGREAILAQGLPQLLTAEHAHAIVQYELHGQREAPGSFTPCCHRWDKIRWRAIFSRFKQITGKMVGQPKGARAALGPGPRPESPGFRPVAAIF